MSYSPTAHVVVLASLDDENWNGQWRLTSEQKLELFLRVEASSIGGDGRITQDDIVNFARQDGNRACLLNLPSAVHGLVDVNFVREVLETYDADRSGSLDRSEWDTFVDLLERRHYAYLLKKSFLNSQAFYGRGQPCLSDALKSAQGLTEELVKKIAGNSVVDTKNSDHIRAVLKNVGRTTRSWQLGFDDDCGDAIIPPGWLADLLFYSANNHPLHGIFSADPEHRLSRKERAAMEVATVSFTVISAQLTDLWVVKEAAPMRVLSDPFVFSIVIVTIPGMLMWKVLFTLFTCPCAFVDKSRAEQSAINRSRMLTSISEAIAYSLIVLGVISLVCHILNATADGNRAVTIASVIGGRLHSYIISWVSMTLLAFNPLVAVPIDSIGLGQWRIEKQRFQTRCLDIILRKDGCAEDVDLESLEQLRALRRRY